MLLSRTRHAVRFVLRGVASPTKVVGRLRNLYAFYRASGLKESAALVGRLGLGMTDSKAFGAHSDFSSFASANAALNAEVLAEFSGTAATGGKRASLSIVVPVFKTREAWLGDLVASLEGQSDRDFELVLVFDGPQPELERFVRGRIKARVRTQILTLPENRGVSAATNAGIRAATSDYVVVVDHDDRLERHFVEAFHVASAVAPSDLYYADEAVVDEDFKDLLTLHVRGAFDLRHYLSHPYIVHPIFVRKSLAETVGLLDETLTISQDVDYFLRLVGAAREITQIPLILYSWRTSPDSLGHAKRDAVMAATKDILSRFVAKRFDWPRFDVVDGLHFNTYIVRPPLPADTRAAIVIPTRNRADILKVCLDSLFARMDANSTKMDIFVVDHLSDERDLLELLDRHEQAGRIRVIRYDGSWNFSAINNHAVKTVRESGDYTHLVFMNNDIELVTTDWLDRLLAQFSYGDVGAVSCCLKFPGDVVQHAGVVVGLCGSAEHSHKWSPFYESDGESRTVGHLGSLLATRDYEAVTAALMVVPVDAFQAVGGFEEELGVGFNDTDLCLRIGALGLKSCYVGDVEAIHYESMSRGKVSTAPIIDPVDPHPDDSDLFVERHLEVIRRGDAYYGWSMDWTTPLIQFSLQRQKQFVLKSVDLRTASERASERQAPYKLTFYAAGN